MMENIKLAIKFIEKDLFFFMDDKKNVADLIKTNQELKNKYQELKNDLDTIKKIINKN